MGYFPNGTSGEAYFCYYCRTCRNNGDEKSEEGCAVWDLHLLWNYDACEDELVPANDGMPAMHGPSIRMLLDSLIPRNAKGENGECLMYRPRAEPAMELAGQTFLEVFDASHHA